MGSEILKSNYGYNTQLKNGNNDVNSVLAKIAELRDLNEKLRKDKKTLNWVI